MGREILSKRSLLFCLAIGFFLLPVITLSSCNNKGKSSDAAANASSNQNVTVTTTEDLSGTTVTKGLKLLGVKYQINNDNPPLWVSITGQIQNDNDFAISDIYIEFSLANAYTGEWFRSSDVSTRSPADIVLKPEGIWQWRIYYQFDSTKYQQIEIHTLTAVRK
jgi:hypothetical protein